MIYLLIINDSMVRSKYLYKIVINNIKSTATIKVSLSLRIQFPRRSRRGRGHNRTSSSFDLWILLSHIWVMFVCFVRVHLVVYESVCCHLHCRRACTKVSQFIEAHGETTRYFTTKHWPTNHSFLLNVYLSKHVCTTYSSVYNTQFIWW